jgi:hypothetical protein
MPLQIYIRGALGLNHRVNRIRDRFYFRRRVPCVARDTCVAGKFASVIERRPRWMRKLSDESLGGLGGFFPLSNALSQFTVSGSLAPPSLP